jgi:nitroimidazol reductase NimA-like FMN-containing flavoprotein (pyridoxamine 5'-phosphate oxidase superfamily)
MKYHMRRADKEIKDPDEVKRVLKKARYMTLAMVKDGDPYLVSLSTGYDDEHNVLYFHSAGEGKKLDYMRASPDVWGQVILDHGYAEKECTHRYASVMFRGRIRFLESSEDKRRAIATMINQLDPEPGPLMERLLKSESLPTTVVGEVTLLEATGKKTPDIQV